MQARPFRRAVFPMTDGSPLNRRCHVVWPSTTTGSIRPGVPWVLNDSAERRLGFEQLEIVSRDPRHQYARRTPVFRREPDETDGITCDVVEDVSRRASIVLDVGKRHRAQGSRPRTAAAENHQPLSIPHG